MSVVWGVLAGSIYTLCVTRCQHQFFWVLRVCFVCWSALQIWDSLCKNSIIAIINLGKSLCTCDFLVCQHVSGIYSWLKCIGVSIVWIGVSVWLATIDRNVYIDKSLLCAAWAHTSVRPSWRKPSAISGNNWLVSFSEEALCFKAVSQAHVQCSWWTCACLCTSHTHQLRTAHPKALSDNLIGRWGSLTVHVCSCHTYDPYMFMFIMQTITRSCMW